MKIKGIVERYEQGILGQPSKIIINLSPLARVQVNPVTKESKSGTTWSNKDFLKEGSIVRILFRSSDVK